MGRKSKSDRYKPIIVSILQHSEQPRRTHVIRNEIEKILGGNTHWMTVQKAIDSLVENREIFSKELQGIKFYWYKSIPE